ncbi:MAG: hypothetical protein ABJA82_10015 [Myxococcales bacterium]
MSATQPRRTVGLNIALLFGSLLVAAGCSPSASTSTVSAKTGGKTGSSSGGAGSLGSGGSPSSTGGSNASGGDTGSGSGGSLSGTGGAFGTGGAVGTGGDSSVAGSTGSGGDTGLGGAGGTGLTGSGGMGGAGFMIACDVSQGQAAGKVVAIAPLISDFTYVDGTNEVKEGSFSFGNFYDAPSGYSFHYPDRGSVSTGGAGGNAGAGGGVVGTGGRGGAAGTGGRGGAAGTAGGGALGPVGITENLTGSDWHISGVIGNYSAFVVTLACATDASAFSGIQFTISGTAGTPNRLTMQAAFAGDEAGSRVTPMTGMCEGTCSAPFTTVNLTATKTLIQIPWSTFTGGRPISTVNPAQLTALRWVFNWNPALQPYAVDLRLDDLSFIPAAGTTIDAGTD